MNIRFRSCIAALLFLWSSAKLYRIGISIRRGWRLFIAPALAGQGAEAVSNANCGSLIPLPASMRSTLTWGQRAEMHRWSAELARFNFEQFWLTSPICTTEIIPS